MNYLIRLHPLEPFLFGGDMTFGELGDDENSSYLVKSRQFPQQTALLGMLRKELMTQASLLTRKVRGEWVDKEKKPEAVRLVGADKFDMHQTQKQNFGVIDAISPIFLMKEEKRYIKKVDIDSYTYKDDILQGYSPKNDIYDNFISPDDGSVYKSSDIFKAVEQIGIKKGGGDDAFFKKTSFLLKENFTFAFYLSCDYDLKSSIVTLGADRSSFRMEVISQPDEVSLHYEDPKGYLTLLSDALITLPVREHCDFAVTSETTHRQLIGKKHSTKSNKFEKSTRLYLYEKGSVFINPSSELIEHLKNENLQQIGYNIFTLKGEQA